MHVPIIVEFVGIAGSGKTTIAAAVVDRLEAHGLSVGYGARLSGSGMCWAAIRAPRAIFAWRHTIRSQVRMPAMRRKHLRKMYTLLGRIVSLASRNQVVVMDEGLIHRFRALRRDSGVKGLSIAEAAKPFSVASLFPREPALLVLVRSDAERAVARVRARDGLDVPWESRDLRRGDDQSLRDADQVLAAFPRAAKIVASNRLEEDISRRANEIVAYVKLMLPEYLGR